MNQPKRFNAVVDQQTYLTLVTLAGRQTMIEGRPVSLAEYVRNILENAVNGPAPGLPKEIIADGQLPVPGTVSG